MAGEDALTRAKAAWAEWKTDETAKILKTHATSGAVLSAEALQLLLDAYGRRIFVRYDARRDLINRNSVKPSKLLSVFKQGEDSKQIEAYEKEIESICADGLGLLEKRLIPKAPGAEEKVICNTMKGNMHYSLCRVLSGRPKKKNSDQALQAYNAASDLAKDELQGGSYTRLNVALNFSNFCCDILGDEDNARAIAQTAYFAGVAYVDSSEIETSKPAQVMAILKTNFMAWNKAAMEKEEAGKK